MNERTEFTKCAKCGRKKRERPQGSLTQWIIDQDSCSCDLTSVTQPDSAGTKFCQTCGKALGTARSGSLTQWIFRPVTCSCARALLDGNSDEAVRMSSFARTEPAQSDSSIEESEALALDPQQFPVQRYKPLKELGTGGSGTVYLCKDTLLGKLVAVKILNRLTSEQFIAFQKEARATSSLNHPSILTLLDFGPTESGTPYMVLEYLDGITLEQYIENHGALNATQFLEIFQQITSALGVAHANGIYHRDIKPSNILIAKSWGENQKPPIKLIDFGGAHLKEMEAMPPVVVQGNTLIGTPAYIPPEIILGKDFDARSEIYSLGCVFFESLTGRQPFVGDTVLETINMHVRDDIQSFTLEVDDRLNHEFDRLVRKCLAKDPNDRFASIEQLQSALSQLESAITGLESKQGRLVEASAVSVGQASTESPAHSVSPAYAGRLKLWLGIAAVILVSTFIAYTCIGKNSTDKDNATRENTKSEQPQAVSPTVNDSEQLKKLDSVDQRTDNLEEAASRGDIDAQVLLADRYFVGKQVTQDQRKAFDLYLSAAKKGSVESQKKVAFIYRTGLGVEKDRRQSFLWNKKAAESGDSDAMSEVGYCYLDGLGTKQDHKMAFKWFSKAVESGNKNAGANLGYMYERGLGTKQNYQMAINLYLQCSAYGATQNNLGSMYEHGRGVKKDYAQAMKWYQTGAARGDDACMYHIGNMYQNALGVERNYMEAATWYRRAAQQDEYHSQARLGEMFEKGLGVPKDYGLAMQWYRQAAEQNYGVAEKAIGNLYQQGLGVNKDPAEAQRWFKRAKMHSKDLGA